MLRDAPDPVELAALATRLAARGPAILAARPRAAWLDLWSSALEALLEPETPERRALMPALLASSRLSPEGLTEALDVVLGGLRSGAASALLEAPPTPGPRALAGAILAGNIPGLAAQCLLPALLAGRPLLLKSASDEPVFAPALVDALVARAPELADAFAAVRFPGTRTDLLEAAFAPAERLVAYGGGEAVEALRARFGARLVAHGPKASLAVVAGDVDLLSVARGLARDVALFDQRGCLSVQAVYVVANGAEALAERLAWALELESRRLPPGPIEPALAAQVQQLRAEAELRGLTVPRLDLAAGTVIVETRPAFRPVPGLRTVRVHPLARLADLVEILEPWRGRLQGAALAGAAAQALRAPLAELGLSRFAPPGELQAADATWANGGIEPTALFD